MNITNPRRSTESPSLFINQTLLRSLIAATLLPTLLVLSACGKLATDLTKALNASSTASKLQMYTSSAITAGSCSPVMLISMDAEGNVVNQTNDLPITLALSGTATTYSDAACTAQITSTTIPALQSSTTFFLKSAGTGSVILNALSAGYAPSVQPISIAAATGTTTQPAKIQISGASAVYSNSCANYLVSVLDSNGLNTALTTALPIATNGLGSGSFYTDASCTTTLSSLSVLSGTSYRSVYYKTPTNETNVFFLQATGYQSASLTVTSSTPAVSVPQKLLITGSNSSTVGLCAGPYTVKILDQNLIQVNVGSNVTVNMSSASGNLNYFSNSICTTSLPSSALTVNSGTSQTTFYTQTTIAGDQRIQAEDPSFSLSATQLDISMKAGAADHLELSSVNNILVDSCQSTFLFLKDANNNILTNSSPVNVTLSDSGSGAFYTDPSCTQQTLSLLLPTGLAQQQFYYKNSVPETTTATASKAGLTSGTQTFTASQSPSQQPYKLLISGNTTLTAGNCSSAYQISVKDVNNISRSFSASPTTVNLLPASTFYSDAGCTTGISSINFTSGQSTKSVFVSRATSANITLTAQTAGLLDGNQTLQILGGAAHHVTVTGSTNISVGQCAVYDVAVQDSLNNLTTAPGSLAISLSSSNTGTFYTSSDCTTGSTTSMTINVGGINQAIYYKAATTGTHTLTAAPTMGLTNGTLAVSSSSNPVTKLTVTSTATGSAGSCQLATVTSRDAGNFVTNVGANTLVTPTATGSAAMFSNSGCTVSAPNITIANGTSSQDFYYKNTVAESVTITAASAGLTSASFNYTTSAGAPSKIRALGASPILAGNCSAITIDILDTNNNAAALTGGTVVNFTGLGSTAKIYSDSGCVSMISSLTMLTGESTRFIYLKDTTAEALSLTFDDPGPLTSSTVAITTQAISPTKLVINGASSTTYGLCVPLSIETQDQFGNLNFVASNTTVTLGGAGTGAFYTSSGCSTTLTSVGFTNAISQVSVYFRTPDVGSYTLTATGGTMTDAGKSLSVQAGPATQIRVLGSASIGTDTCTVYTAQVRDSGNITTTVASNTAVNLTGAGNGSFYSDASCVGGITGITITSGNSQANFYYRNATAETATLNADDTGSLTAGTLAVTTTAPSGGGGGGSGGQTSSGNTPISLSFTGPNQVLSGGCSGPYNLTSKDSAGAPTNVTTNTNVSLSESSALGTLFYTNSSCTGAVSTTTLPAGSFNVQIYVVVPVSGTANLSASASGLFSAAKTVTAATGARLTSEDAPINDWIFIPKPGVSASRTFTINLKNTGAAQASNIVFSGSLPSGFTFVGGSYPGTGGTCTANRFLDPNQSCTIMLTLTTSSLDKSTGAMTLAYQEGSTSKSVVFDLNVQPTTSRFITKMGSSGPTAQHLCATLSDGSVGCWGYNAQGQLAEGHAHARGLTPGVQSIRHIQRVPGVYNPVAVATGGNFSCAILSTGLVKCWGYNANGELGLGDTSNRGDDITDIKTGWGNTPLGTGKTAKSITLGTNHACVILNDDTVKCWGYNGNGQLGQGDTSARGDNSNELGDNLNSINLGTGLTAKQISSGSDHVCAILSNDKMKCWGNNGNGQLGYGDTSSRGNSSGQMGDNLVTHDFGLFKPLQVATGTTHTCVLVQNSSDQTREVRCWGRNDYGQLGRGDTTQYGSSGGQTAASAAKVDLGATEIPVQIATGSEHSCAFLNNHQIKCWGYNAAGQLALGDSVNRGTTSGQLGDTLNYAKATLYGSQALAVQAASNSTCATLLNLRVKCWGRNDYGQAGVDDNNAIGQSPIGGYPEVQIYRKNHIKFIGGTCYVMDDDEIVCPSPGYGTTPFLNTFYNLNYTMPWTGYKPLAIDRPLKDFKAYGANWGCMITATDQVKCFGINSYGQMGQGNGSAVSGITSAIDLGTGKTAKAISVGSSGHVCAILNDDSVKCWGRNNLGQLGQGDTSDRGDGANEMGDNLLAVNLGTGLTAKALSLGSNYSCAILSDDSVKCWGQNNYGQLGVAGAGDRGDGGSEMGNSLPAVNFGAGLTAKAISVSTEGQHTCVITNTDNVKCWGYNPYGQLGYDDTTDRGLASLSSLANVNLGAGRTALSIAAITSYSTCAVLDDFSVKCWGYASNGILGQNNTTQYGNAGGANSMTNLVPIEFGGAFRKATKLFSNTSAQPCAMFEDATAADSVEIVRCWGATHGNYAYSGSTSGYNIGSGNSGYTYIAVAGPVAGAVDQIQVGRSFDYIRPGSNIFSVPATTTSVRASVWGGGGGSNSNSYSYLPRAGAFSFKEFSVTPGDSIGVTTGSGGVTTVAGDGSASSILLITAGGGTGENNGSGSSIAVGGTVNESGSTFSNNSSGGHSIYSAYGGYLPSANPQGNYLQPGMFPGGAGGLSSSYGSYYNMGAAGRVIVEPKLTDVISTGTTNTSGTAPVDYTTPGVFVYTVPTGIKSLRIQGWGAGGGGGGAKNSYNGYAGGGGAYFDSILQVSEGQSFIVNVGSGGLGGACQGADGTNVTLGASISGGDTQFGFGSTILTAGGGKRGNAQSNSCTPGTNCGDGGTATGGVINTAGGQGAVYSGSYGGAGGASGGGAAGGVANTATNVAGKPGASPGGGGGAASYDGGSNNYCYSGGKGGNGRLLVTPYSN